MSAVLDVLEWFARYGSVDIAFGIGITGLVAGSLRRLLPRNLDQLHVHVQPIPLRARGPYESYDDALGIFVANSGSTNIYIARAFFRAYARRLLFFRQLSELPIYPNAFKSAAHNAYEIKFGEQWLEFDVLIKPSQRVMTYLPLTMPADPATIVARHCGTVVLEYSTAGARRCTRYPCMRLLRGTPPGHGHAAAGAWCRR